MFKANLAFLTIITTTLAVVGVVTNNSRSVAAACRRFRHYKSLGYKKVVGDNTNKAQNFGLGMFDFGFKRFDFKLKKTEIEIPKSEIIQPYTLPTRLPMKTHRPRGSF